jgi:hypothetical protein
MSGGGFSKGRRREFGSAPARSRMPSTGLTIRTDEQRAASRLAAERWWRLWDPPISAARLVHLFEELQADRRND